MRIRTDGKFAYREELVDDVADQLGENTRVGAVEASYEFTQAMLPALAEAVEHPDMTEELAEILTTRVVDVEYRVEADVSVREEARETSDGLHPSPGEPIPAPRVESVFFHAIPVAGPSMFRLDPNVVDVPLDVPAANGTVHLRHWPSVSV
jgi:hypothetical protein